MYGALRPIRGVFEMDVTRQDWIDDCQRWRGRVLTGKYAHWCFDWDGLPVDETTQDEWECCTCFPLCRREQLEQLPEWPVG